MGREKIKTISELSAIIEDHRREGKKIVFTNGCYDLIHVGHVRLLEDSKKLGDILVVGINSDSSVQRLKGASRPILQEPDRAEIVSALESVDYVVIFSEDTPVETIAILKPHIHVKGGDYDMATIPEAKVVQSYGGELRAVPLVTGRSTTTIIQKIRNCP
jgi:rfaE bifunctional protein nucleotidyltransferase chain/domain